MFTGIVEAIGIVKSCIEEDGNLRIRIQSEISHALKIDQSVSHNGICLTVVELKENWHEVIAIKETINRTDIVKWTDGSKINLERCMLANSRFDGHIVQGHVDCVAKCISVIDQGGSKEFLFEYDSFSSFTVEKGSIAINGVSLTVVKSLENSFSVCLIPFSLENTNFNQIEKGVLVNLEFDIIGKYIQKLMNKTQGSKK